MREHNGSDVFSGPLGEAIERPISYDAVEIQARRAWSAHTPPPPRMHNEVSQVGSPAVAQEFVAIIDVIVDDLPERLRAIFRRALSIAMQCQDGNAQITAYEDCVLVLNELPRPFSPNVAALCQVLTAAAVGRFEEASFGLRIIVPEELAGRLDALDSLLGTNH